MNLYMNNNNQVYSGDRQENDRELPEEEINDYIAQQEKENLIKNLQLRIEEFDKKRIRAISEPQLKDETSGQTWLEYYTEQIRAIRLQISAL